MDLLNIHQMSPQVFEPGLLVGSDMQLFDPSLPSTHLSSPLETSPNLSERKGIQGGDDEMNVLEELSHELDTTPQQEQQEHVPETEIETETALAASIAVSRPGRNRRAPKVFSPDKDFVAPQKPKATSSSKSNSVKRGSAKQDDDDGDDEDDDDEEEDTNLYCMCRGRDDGSPMVQCDGCNEWFHTKCLGLKSADVRVKHWICPTCEEIANGLFCEPKTLIKTTTPTSRPKKKPHNTNPKKVPASTTSTQSDGTARTAPSPTNPTKHRKTMEKQEEQPRLKMKIATSALQPDTDTPLKPCQLVGCNKMSRKGSTFCSAEHENKHAEDMFNAMLFGQAPPPSSSVAPHVSPTKSPTNVDGTARPVPMTHKSEMEQNVAESRHRLSLEKAAANQKRRPSDTNSGMRLTVRTTLRSIFMPKASEYPFVDLTTLMESIEEAMFNHYNKKVTPAYNSHFKLLAVNLRMNLPLVAQLFAASVSADQLIKMSPEELCDHEIVKARERAAVDRLRSITVAPSEIKIVTNEKDSDRRVDLNEKAEKETDQEEKVKEKRRTSLTQSQTKDEEEEEEEELKETQTDEADQAGEDTFDLLESLIDQQSQRSGSTAADSSLRKQIKSVVESPPKKVAEKDKMLLPRYMPGKATEAIKEARTSSSASSKLDRPQWEGTIRNAGHTKVRMKAMHAYSEDGSPTSSSLATDIVDVRGRIRPNEVWDYVSKLKVSTSKDVVIYRLEPDSDDDEVGYISLFSYFHSRKRFGVLGCKRSGSVKDMYLVAISEDSPLPAAITDGNLKGPGFGAAGQKDTLMMVVVKNAERKRKRSADAGARSTSQKNTRVAEVSSSNGDFEQAYSPFDMDDDVVDGVVDAPYSPTQMDVYDTDSKLQESVQPQLEVQPVVPLPPIPPKPAQPLQSFEPVAPPPQPDAAPAVNPLSPQTVTNALSGVGLDFGAIHSMLQTINAAKSQQVQQPATPPIVVPPAEPVVHASAYPTQTHVVQPNTTSSSFPPDVTSTTTRDPYATTDNSQYDYQQAPPPQHEERHPNHQQQQQQQQPLQPTPSQQPQYQQHQQHQQQQHEYPPQQPRQPQPRGHGSFAEQDTYPYQQHPPTQGHYEDQWSHQQQQQQRHPQSHHGRYPEHNPQGRQDDREGYRKDRSYSPRDSGHRDYETRDKPGNDRGWNTRDRSYRQ